MAKKGEEREFVDGKDAWNDGGATDKGLLWVRKMLPSNCRPQSCWNRPFTARNKHSRDVVHEVDEFRPVTNSLIFDGCPPVRSQR